MKTFNGMDQEQKNLLTEISFLRKKLGIYFICNAGLLLIFFLCYYFFISSWNLGIIIFLFFIFHLILSKIIRFNRKDYLLLYKKNLLLTKKGWYSLNKKLPGHKNNTILIVVIVFVLLSVTLPYIINYTLGHQFIILAMFIFFPFMFFSIGIMIYLKSRKDLKYLVQKKEN